MVVIQPFDKGSLGAIEKAIRNSDLGVNPTNDGAIIRVVFPELSEERRREYIKVARHKAEDSRVSIRNIRTARQGRHRQAGQERRGGRGRRSARGGASSTSSPTPTWRRWTSCSSTRKPSCWRLAQGIALRLKDHIATECGAMPVHPAAQNAVRQATAAAAAERSRPRDRAQDDQHRPQPARRDRRRARAGRPGPGHAVHGQGHVPARTSARVVGVALWELSRALGPGTFSLSLIPIAVGGAAMLALAYWHGDQGRAGRARRDVHRRCWPGACPAAPTGYVRDVTAGVFALVYLPLMAAVRRADAGPAGRRAPGAALRRS